MYACVTNTRKYVLYHNFSIGTPWDTGVYSPKSVLHTGKPVPRLKAMQVYNYVLDACLLVSETLKHSRCLLELDQGVYLNILLNAKQKSWFGGSAPKRQ